MDAEKLAKAASALEDVHAALKGAMADHKESLAKADAAHQEMHGKVRKALKGVKEALGQKPDPEEEAPQKVDAMGDLQKAMGVKDADLAKAQDDLKKAKAEIEELKKRPVMSPVEKAFIEAHAEEITKAADGTKAPGAPEALDVTKMTDPLALSKAINTLGRPFRL